MPQDIAIKKKVSAKAADKSGHKSNKVIDNLIWETYKSRGLLTIAWNCMSVIIPNDRLLTMSMNAMCEHVSAAVKMAISYKVYSIIDHYEDIDNTLIDDTVWRVVGRRVDLARTGIVFDDPTGSEEVLEILQGSWVLGIDPDRIVGIDIIDKYDYFKLTPSKKNRILKNIKDIVLNGVRLRDLAALLSDFDPNRYQAVEKFCSDVQALARSNKGLDTPLPSVAPERWANRKLSDKTPGHFIARVYKKWLFEGSGFHSGHLRNLDRTLQKEYYDWMNEGAPGAPKGFNLPYKDEAMAAEPPLSADAVEAGRHVEKLRKRRQRAAARDKERSGW